MVEAALSQIHDTALLKIIEYMSKHDGLFLFRYISLLKKLEEMEIIEVITHNEKDQWIIAKLSDAHLRGYKIYLRINTENRFLRWFYKVNLTGPQLEHLETLRRDCEEVEKIIAEKERRKNEKSQGSYREIW